MELSELDPNERIALVALIKTMALADHAVSSEEEDMLAGLIDEMGEEQYATAIDAADRRFETEAQLKAFLQTIQREEARELIYATALDLAMADVVSGNESPLLRWLASTWNVEATIESSEEDTDA